MDERNVTKSQNSNIIVENRKRVNVSGVKDALSFDETSIVLDTELGVLTLKGRDFRINKLNVDVGEFVIEGYVDSMAYSDGYAGEGGGLLSKLFK